MTANTVEDEFNWQYHSTLAKVISKKPKLFSKWVDIKEQFAKRGADDKPISPTFTIGDLNG